MVATRQDHVVGAVGARRRNKLLEKSLRKKSGDGTCRSFMARLLVVLHDRFHGLAWLRWMVVRRIWYALYEDF